MKRDQILDGLEVVELYFPSREMTLNLGDDIQAPGREQFRTTLFAQQRTFEELVAQRLGRVSCGCTERGKARFMVKRLVKGRREALLYLARFPGSGPSHTENCYFRKHDFSPPPAPGMVPEKIHRLGGRDFAALFRELPDPELRAAPADTSALRISPEYSLRKSVSRESIGLRRFGTELLQRSGLCEWKPAFRYSRSETVFDGRVAGALDSLLGTEPASKAARFVHSLPGGVPILRWSALKRSGEANPDKCIGFGFVQSLGSLTETGARELRIRSNPDLPLMVPRSVLAQVARNPESPLGIEQKLDHPLWVIFVAQKFGDDWKIHELAGFRITAVGAMPVSSDNEEHMVVRLIAERRAFRRCLTSPPGLGGRKFIPDFQLLDTPMEEFIEVAGRMHEVAFQKNITAKIEEIGALRLLVWDTRYSLAKFVLPLRRGHLNS